MIYIISNISFGLPKLSKYQIEYFEDYLIPLVEKKLASDDKLIIRGDIFYNTINTNFNLLLKVRNIFEKLSIVPIEIIGNNYCFDIIKNFTLDKPIIQIENMEFDIIIEFDIIKSSLFDMKDKNQIGFSVIKNKKIKFIENKKSPRFREVEINSMDDIENIDINKDFIDIIIDSELIEKPEYKNKIDIFLSKNLFNNIFYKEKSNKKTNNNIIIKNSNIKNIIMDNIDDDLKEEMINIFKLCEK